jgi:two-component system, LuxR family, sensor kinase FixL
MPESADRQCWSSKAERLALAAEASGTFLIDWDLASGTIQRCGNDAVLATSGLPREETAEQWKDKLHPEDRARVLDRMRRCLEGSDGRWVEEYRLRRDDGGYAWVSMRAVVLRRPDGTARRLVGVGRDVSDRRAGEEERRRVASEFIRQSQVHAMTAATTTLAHELNQPLMAASNYLAVARRALADVGGEPAREVERELVDAQEQIGRAGEIIRRIRSLIGEQRAGPRRHASLEEVARSLPMLLSAIDACTAAQIEFSLDPTADRVRTDPMQLEQILLNLIRNACEAATAGGHPQVVVSSRRAGDRRVEIEVRDNGPGVPADLLPSLLDSMESSASAGLGLGLPISRAIVDALGGRLWARNNSGGGASFLFSLPLTPEVAAPGH